MAAEGTELEKTATFISWKRQPRSSAGKDGHVHQRGRAGLCKRDDDDDLGHAKQDGQCREETGGQVGPTHATLTARVGRLRRHYPTSTPPPLNSQLPASTASTPTSAPAGQLQCGCTNAVTTDGGVYRNCRKLGSHGKVLGRRSLIPEYLIDICCSASTSLVPLSTTFPFKYSSPQNYQQP